MEKYGLNLVNSKIPTLFKLPPPNITMKNTNNLASIQYRKYVDGSVSRISRNNDEYVHSLDETIDRKIISQGIVGNCQYSSYVLHVCENRNDAPCPFRVIERREQYSGNSTYSILEYHSVECIQSETLSRIGEISEAEFFDKNALDVSSDRGNRGGMIIIHKGKIHRNKGKSSSEYRRFFCKEKDCSHRIIERKSDGMICIRGFHECNSTKSPKKAAAYFRSKELLCVSMTNGHLKGGKPAKNLICNGCLFLSNRKNVLLGGRKFEENTYANEYICQIKNQFKRNRQKSRSNFHCNAIIKERISDGSIILQGNHDAKCLHNSKKFYSAEVHSITQEEGEMIRVNGILFYPLSTRIMKFGREEFSVMEFICSCKTYYNNITCNAVVLKHLEQATFYLSGKHDSCCLKEINGMPRLKLEIVSPARNMISPQIQQVIPPPPPPTEMINNIQKQIVHQTRSRIKVEKNQNIGGNPNLSLLPFPVGGNFESGKRKGNPFQPKTRGSNQFPKIQGFLSNPIPELRILSIYPSIVERPGSTVNILVQCPPNYTNFFRPNLFSVYLSEYVKENESTDNRNTPKTEFIPQTSFYFPAIQFGDQIGMEWGVPNATCRILLTLPFFFNLSGVLNLCIVLPGNVRLEMNNALIYSTDINGRQNQLEGREKNSKKRKLAEILVTDSEKENLSNSVAYHGARICSVLPNRQLDPKLRYVEVYCFLEENQMDKEIDLFFGNTQVMVIGVFQHEFNVRGTRLSKIYNKQYLDECHGANCIITVELSSTVLQNTELSATVIIDKKIRLERKNCFVISSVDEIPEENSYPLNPFDVSMPRNLEEMFRTKRKAEKFVTFEDIGFGRIDSFESFDDLVNINELEM